MRRTVAGASVPATRTANRATPAARQLEAIAGLDPRNRGTTYQSAGSLLAAYRHPDVLQTTRAGLSAESFLSGANTLYICAPAHRQRELAPLVVALLSSIFEHAATRAAAAGPQQPTLRVLLDELANIAPIRNLPQLLSQASSQGVPIAPVVQSIAQLEERYGDAAQTILANCTTKLFMGPVTDETTRSYLAGLLGHHRDRESQPEPKATPPGAATARRRRTYICKNVHAETGLCDAPRVEAEAVDLAVIAPPQLAVHRLRCVDCGAGPGKRPT